MKKVGFELASEEGFRRAGCLRIQTNPPSSSLKQSTRKSSVKADSPHGHHCPAHAGFRDCKRTNQNSQAFEKNSWSAQGKVIFNCPTQIILRETQFFQCKGERKKIQARELFQLAVIAYAIALLVEGQGRANTYAGFSKNWMVPHNSCSFHRQCLRLANNDQHQRTVFARQSPPHPPAKRVQTKKWPFTATTPSHPNPIRIS